MNCGTECVDPECPCPAGVPHWCSLWANHDAWHECHCGHTWWPEPQLWKHWRCHTDWWTCDLMGHDGGNECPACGKVGELIEEVRKP